MLRKAATCAAVVACLSVGADRSFASPVRADGFSVEPGWKLNLGVAYLDTMPFPSHDVLPVVATVLARDRWRVESSDPLTGRIITEWQPVKHLFVRFLLGDIQERCVVDVAPIEGKRCVVKFRAALASRKSIAGNPLMPKVEKEYEEGVLRWQRRVRHALVEQSRRRAVEASRTARAPSP